MTVQNTNKNINDLNAPDAATRLSALEALRAANGAEKTPQTSADINNHIHTTYSFSPYSPAKAVWMAHNAGLATAGIVDHDSISGAPEFIKAGKIMGLPVTCGFEIRCTHTETAIGGRRTNNPDQEGVSYILFHGVPQTQFEATDGLLRRIREVRGKRNRAMTEKINALFSGLQIDYDKDVLPLSQHSDGGAVTERHLLFALAHKLLEQCPAQTELAKQLGGLIPVSDESNALMARIYEEGNSFAAYDLLGLLKAHLVSHFYIPSGPEECPDIREVVKFADKHGIIASYPYLGDVGVSVTGDKKTQSFEDSYLDELFEIVNELGFRAVTYAPSRNTKAQLDRVRALCRRYSLLEISGEDINTPRQSFICEAMRDKEYSSLVDGAWALIGHEKAAAADISLGFTALDMPLQEKVSHFKKLGMEE